ncbi:Rebeccamycin O-methyltransferase [Slackia heliotrinireducens]|nr:nitroreductase family protein [Slackia heliotrinireducens]VEG99041.1 Rebeccamycin O-methyltransferase [Slackia heliotrinireducens]
MPLAPNQNPALPEGEGGRTMLERMNGGRHARLSEWSMPHISLPAQSRVVDLGCGGGANVARLLGMQPEGTVAGLDYSPLSIEMSKETNAEAIAQGRCTIVQGDVSALPFEDGAFDVATAFETVYFWPNISQAFGEVFRTLADDGVFMVANEVDGSLQSDYDVLEQVEGMSMYAPDQLEAFMRGAGFTDVQVDVHPDERWTVVIGHKRVASEGAAMSLNELYRTCRTYRLFKQDPLPEGLMGDIMENVRIASCASNAQSLNYIVVTDPDMVAKMQPLVAWAAYLPRDVANPRPGEEPVAFIVVVKKEGSGRFADVDAGIVANTIATTAWEAGVGSCIMAAIRRKALAELLDVAENDEVLLAVALGYPAHTSTIVDMPESGSVEYTVDDDRNYYVPKRALEDIARFV